MTRKARHEDCEHLLEATVKPFQTAARVTWRTRVSLRSDEPPSRDLRDKHSAAKQFDTLIRHTHWFYGLSRRVPQTPMTAMQDKFTIRAVASDRPSLHLQPRAEG